MFDSYRRTAQRGDADAIVSSLRRRQRRATREFAGQLATPLEDRVSRLRRDSEERKLRRGGGADSPRMDMSELQKALMARKEKAGV